MGALGVGYGSLGHSIVLAHSPSRTHPPFVNIPTSSIQVVWMHEALKLGFSVFFVDIDVFMARNPLPWLVE